MLRRVVFHQSLAVDERAWEAKPHWRWWDTVSLLLSVTSSIQESLVVTCWLQRNKMYSLFFSQQLLESEKVFGQNWIRKCQKSKYVYQISFQRGEFGVRRVLFQLWFVFSWCVSFQMLACRKKKQNKNLKKQFCWIWWPKWKVLWRQWRNTTIVLWVHIFSPHLLATFLFQVSKSEVFREVTLELELNEENSQWLLQQTAHIDVQENGSLRWRRSLRHHPAQFFCGTCDSAFLTCCLCSRWQIRVKFLRSFLANLIWQLSSCKLVGAKRCIPSRKTWNVNILRQIKFRKTTSVQEPGLLFTSLYNIQIRTQAQCTIFTCSEVCLCCQQNKSSESTFVLQVTFRHIFHVIASVPRPFLQRPHLVERVIVLGEGAPTPHFSLPSIYFSPQM